MSSVASLRAEYNDNRRLTTAEHEGIFGGVLNLKSNISAESEVSVFEIKPRFTFERYSGTGDGELDSNNQYLDMLTSYNAESSRWTLSGNYTRDNTLISEQEGTGFVQTLKRREKWNIDPQWIQELTEWTIFSLKLSNTSVTYEDAATLGLVDYDVKSIYSVISYSLAESITINSTLYGSRLEAVAAGNETDTLGFSFGFDYKIQETLGWGMQIGAQKVDSTVTSNPKFPPITITEETKSGYTFDINAASEFEYTRWTLNLDRSSLPSGVGRLIQQDKIALRITTELTQTIRSNISITVLRNQEIQQGAVAQNRDYQNTVVSLNWNIMPGWLLKSAYSYRKNKYQTNTAEATSNAVQLTVIYTDLNK